MNLATAKFPGSARASRAGDRALAIANFAESPIDYFRLHDSWMLILMLKAFFGGGAEMRTRGRVRSPELDRCSQ
jgi:hypothetical protein